jgi:uncharacterized protein (DUF2147 family)
MLRISLVLLLATAVSAAGDVADVEGTWLSGDGDGWIDIRIEDETLNGYIAGSPLDVDGEPPRLDTKNPDATMRNRKLTGLRFLHGFHYDPDSDRWTGGSVYDPNSGNTYKGTITLVDINTLKLRGYIGIPLFGRSDVWSRVIP